MGRPKAKNVKRDKTTGRSRGLATAEVIEIAFANRVRRVGKAAVVVDDRSGARWANARSGFSLGILSLWGQISNDQFEAGEWYTNMISRYCALRGLPLPTPKSAALMLVGGGQTCRPEPDKEAVARAVERHKTVREALLKAGADIGVGSRVNAITYQVCIEDRAPETLSVGDIGNLRVGLNALSRVSS